MFDKLLIAERKLIFQSIYIHKEFSVYNDFHAFKFTVLCPE